MNVVCAMEIEVPVSKWTKFYNTKGKKRPRLVPMPKWAVSPKELLLFKSRKTLNRAAFWPLKWKVSEQNWVRDRSSIVSFTLDRYYLNGNRSITESSVFQIGQTHLWYRRGNKHEVLEGRGHPLSDDVDIMILILNDDLIKIKSLHWELVNKTHTSQSRLHHYSWTWENGTNDDCSCVTRQAHCTFRSAQNESVVVSDQLCDSKSKPRPVKCRTTLCSDQSSSAPRWQVGAWRNCEGRCWPQEALQRRSLLCVRTLANNRTHTIPTSICLHWLSSIPITVRECPANLSSTIPKCTSLKTYSHWTTGEWIGVSIRSISSELSLEWTMLFRIAPRSIPALCNIVWSLVLPMTQMLYARRTKNWNRASNDVAMPHVVNGSFRIGRATWVLLEKVIGREQHACCSLFTALFCNQIKWSESVSLSLPVHYKSGYQVKIITRQIVSERRNIWSSLETVLNRWTPCLSLSSASVFRLVYQCNYHSQCFLQHIHMWFRSTTIVDSPLYSAALYQCFKFDHQESQRENHSHPTE